MKRRMVIVLIVVLLLPAVAAGLRGLDLQRVTAAPDSLAAPNSPAGFASPINGGCYIAAPDVCKIHIDPFTININDGGGAHLEKFTLYANGSPIYDFRTDVSNPPNVDYSPSLVMQDFAAQCGETYYVNMVAKDSTDANPLNYGQTKEFTCPSLVP